MKKKYRSPIHEVSESEGGTLYIGRDSFMANATVKNSRGIVYHRTFHGGEDRITVNSSKYSDGISLKKHEKSYMSHEEISSLLRMF